MPLTQFQQAAQHFAYNFYFYGHLIGALLAWAYAFYLVAQEYHMHDIAQRLHGTRPERRGQGIYAPKLTTISTASIINESNRVLLYVLVIVAAFLTINLPVAAFIKWQLWHLIK